MMAREQLGKYRMAISIENYQKFTQSHKQTQKRKGKKRKQIKKEESVEDELVIQFNNTMNISTKRRRVNDVQIYIATIPTKTHPKNPSVKSMAARFEQKNSFNKTELQNQLKN